MINQNFTNKCRRCGQCCIEEVCAFGLAFNNAFSQLRIVIRDNRRVRDIRRAAGLEA